MWEGQIRILHIHMYLGLCHNIIMILSSSWGLFLLLLGLLLLPLTILSTYMSPCSTSAPLLHMGGLTRQIIYAHGICD